MDKIIKIFLNIKHVKIISISAIFLIVTVLSVIILNKSISYNNIQNTASSYLNLKIETINPNIKFNHKLDLTYKADKFEVYNTTKTKKYLAIDKLNISIKPLNLLFNKLNIKNLSVDNVLIAISRNSKGEIDIIKDINMENLHRHLKHPYEITKLNSKINNFEIIFHDNYKIQSDIKFKTENNIIQISKRNKLFKITQKGLIETVLNSKTQTSLIDIDVSSKYPFKNINSKDLKTSITVKDANLHILSDIARNIVSKDIISLEGDCDLSLSSKEENQNLNLTVKNHKIKLKNKLISPFKKNIDLGIIFNIDKDTLNIENLKLSSNDLNFSTKGAISKFNTKNPQIDLKLDIINTELNNLLYYIPDNLIYFNPKGIPKLKSSNFFAKLDGSLEIKNSPLDIQGGLKASDIHIPDYPKPYRQNDVSARFIGNKVKIFTRVYTPQNEYITINGTSNLDDSLYGQYDIASTKNIDLAFAQKYLVPIQQIIGFNIGPVPIMKINGTGNIDIKTKGTIKDAQIFGTFKAFNASAEIDGLNAHLTNGDCELVFDNRNLIFKKIKGKINEADFSLSGIGNTKGEVELSANVKNSRLKTILDIFNNSLFSKPYINLTKNISATSGLASAEINLKGTIKDYEDVNFLSYLDLDGLLELQNSKIFLNNGLKLQKVTGSLDFGKTQKADFDFNISNSKFNFKLNSQTPLTNLQNERWLDFKSEITSSKISSSDILNELKNLKALPKDIKQILSAFQEYKFFTKAHIISNGKFCIDNYIIKNLSNKGYIVGLNDKSNSNIQFENGHINFNNSKILFNNLTLKLSQGTIKISGDVNDILTNPDFNIKANLNNLDLSKISSTYSKIKSNQAFIKNGEIAIKNNTIKLNNISTIYNSLPLFLNAQIKDFTNNKEINIDFSTIINEQTTDNVINPYLTYPIKIKGELPIKGIIKGNNKNYTIDFNAKIPPNSDISFSGANLGDININRVLDGKIEVNNNIAKFNNLKYTKFITNQNGKTSPITALKINGQIVQSKEDYSYNNLKITTNTPISVRMLNLLFKKSLLKKGNFECDINLNGNTKTPNIQGRVFLEDLDIPLYDTKINNINFNITDKIINGEIIANSKNSDLNIKLKAQNKANAPYIIENINIESSELDIYSLISSLSSQKPINNDINPKQDFQFSTEDIVIKNGFFDIKNVKYEKINSTNLIGKFNLEDNIFNLKESNFDIAQGKITAKGKYNIKNTKLDLRAEMNNCDSNELTKEFLNLSGQIYGKMNGSVLLSGKNLNTPDNIKNLLSNIDFSIDNGKMPKLGSLEYILRAGNVVKNGVLGLSLNNLIQILTPYKTGEFEKINGKLSISNGRIKDLEIMSKGKNMSLYLEGEYDILKNYANITLYGKLSQTISNSLGAIGNISLKQFFESISSNKLKTSHSEELNKKLNKIPSIETQEATPKFFSAKVLGDINKDNYVKSFMWEN